MMFSVPLLLHLLLHLLLLILLVVLRDTEVEAMHSSDYILTTIAGNDTSFYNGDNLPALDSELSRVFDVSLSGTYLYIADPNSQRVREVDLTTGIMKTLAGNGKKADGTDILATEGSLHQPSKICAASNRDVYIADTSSNKIKKVTHSDGYLTTIAGNDDDDVTHNDATVVLTGATALDVKLNKPEGIYYDEDNDDIYISDTENHRVLRVNSGGTTVDTIAGNGACATNTNTGVATSISLCYPRGLYYWNNNLYLADYGNCVVRKISLSTNPAQLTNFAGNGTCDYSGENILATNAMVNYPTDVFVNSSNGDVFISDSENLRIRKIDGATSNITTVAGTGRSGFDGDGFPATGEDSPVKMTSPQAVTIDPTNSNMYIADGGNFRVRLVDGSTGNISTIAGKGTGGFAGDGGPAVHAQMNTPRTVFVDDHLNLYISDSYNSRIRFVDHNTGIITTIAGNGKTGDGADDIQANTSEISQPTGIFVDNSNDVYFTDSSNNKIKKVDPDGIVTTIAGTGSAGFSGDGGSATSATLKFPMGVHVTSTSIYISDTNNHRIRKIDMNSGIISTVAGTGVTGDNGYDNIPALEATFTFPTGIYVDTTNGVDDIYISDRKNNKIRLINGTSGNITTVAGDGGFSYDNDDVLATATNIGNPWAVSLDPLSGDLYIADTYNDRIRVVDGTTKIIHTLSGTGEYGYYGNNIDPINATYSRPRGIFFHVNTGIIYIADSESDRIRQAKPKEAPTPSPTFYPSPAPTSLTLAPTPAFCEAGEYRGSDYQCYECPGGEYSDQTVYSFAPSNCTTCSAGTFSSNGSSTCQTCPAGYICSTTKTAEPKICPENKYSSPGSVKCEYCVYPYISDAGSSSCVGVYLNANGVWLGISIVVFLITLILMCKLDLYLVCQVLSFNDYIVLISFIDFIGDIYYLFNEKFHNMAIFAMIIVCIILSLFVMPCILYTKRLKPRIIKDMYMYFPGYYFVSEELYFIKYDMTRGVIGIRDQLIFKPKTAFDLEILSDDKLRDSLASLTNVSKSSLEMKPRDHCMQDLIEFYDDDKRWNPFDMYPEGRNTIKKTITQVIVNVSVVMLQCLNFITYMFWPIIMIFRLPIVLLFMIYFSSTKLVFFKQPWNMLIYTWVLDESALKTDKDKEIDIELMNLCKVQEFIFKTCTQLVLQSINSVSLNGHISNAYVFSLFGTVLDLSVCIYRLGSGLWLSKRVSNKEELKDLGMRLKAARHFGLENLLSMFMRIIGDKSLGNRLSDMESLINHENDVRILALFKENIVNSVDHRVKEIEKQIEQEMYEGEGSGIDNDEQTWNWTPSSWKRVLPLQY